MAEGSCLCGAVRIRVTAPPLLTSACHCRDCQKLSAGPFTLTAMFPEEAVAVTGELVPGALRTPGRDHLYCATCLTFVLSRIEGAGPRINLRLSLLDQARAFAPFIETMTDQKMPWVRVPAVHSFARYPAGPDALRNLMDDYARHHSGDRP